MCNEKEMSDKVIYPTWRYIGQRHISWIRPDPDEGSVRDNLGVSEVAMFERDGLYKGLVPDLDLGFTAETEVGVLHKAYVACVNRLGTWTP